MLDELKEFWENNLSQIELFNDPMLALLRPALVFEYGFDANSPVSMLAYKPVFTYVVSTSSEFIGYTGGILRIVFSSVFIISHVLRPIIMRPLSLIWLRL